MSDAPRRLRGTAVHKELASFIEHVNRQKDASSVIWADPERCGLAAILNYHRPAALASPDAPAGAPGKPRWGDHRALYTCPWSTQWRVWVGANEKWMSQETFGQLIEDNMGDLANPDPEMESDRDMPTPAKVLEVARHLVVYAWHNFERKINVSDGTGTFTWKKDNEVAGSTKVPKGFLLGIPVFDAGAVYRLPVRLRYQVDAGAAKFQISLYQPHVVIRDAFDQVRTEAATGTALPLFVGSPE